RRVSPPTSAKPALRAFPPFSAAPVLATIDPADTADWLPPDSCPSRSWPRPGLGRVAIADTRNVLEGSPSCRDAAGKSDDRVVVVPPGNLPSESVTHVPGLRFSSGRVPSAVPDEAGQLARDGGDHLRVRLAARLAFLSSLDGDLGAVRRFQNVSILAEFNLVSESSLIGRALATEGLARGLALMIGDRKEDIEGARANGVRSIGVTWGYGSREELEGAGADHIASSVP